jgi:hypothetical protein
VDELGPDYRLTDWLHERTIDCPQKNQKGVTPECGAHMPDLQKLRRNALTSAQDAHPSSAARPASVIRTRVTSTLRRPARARSSPSSPSQRS